jgi:hypothetical protein
VKTKMQTKLLILAVLATTMTTAAAARADDGGFWCWTSPDGESALCAPEQSQCEASREGFNRTNLAFGETGLAAECRWQKTAWELIMKHPSGGPGHHYPTKALCMKARDKGDRCRLAR